MNNIDEAIKKIRCALGACACPANEDLYKLEYCIVTLRDVLQDLKAIAEPEDNDPWGVLGALDEATKIR